MGALTREGPPSSAPAFTPTPQAPPLAAPSRDDASLATAERWRAALGSVRTASTRHGASLSFGRLLWLRAGEVALAYPAQAGFHRTTVSTGTGRALVEKALTAHFGRPTRLVVETVVEGDLSAPLSVAEEELSSRVAHEKSTEGQVRSHPAVRAALKILGGELEHIQVLTPVQRPVVEETVDESS